MRPVIRYQSQLPARRSYKPARRLWFRPTKGRLQPTFQADRPVVIRLVVARINSA